MTAIHYPFFSMLFIPFYYMLTCIYIFFWFPYFPYFRFDLFTSFFYYRHRCQWNRWWNKIQKHSIQLFTKQCAIYVQSNISRYWYIYIRQHYYHVFQSKKIRSKRCEDISKETNHHVLRSVGRRSQKWWRCLTCYEMHGNKCIVGIGSCRCG